MNPGPLTSLPGLRPELTEPFLRVEELAKTFPAGGSGRAKRPPIRAVDGISFDVASGETLALVGETGCGKSTAARCVLRLVEPSAGRVLLDGRDLASSARPSCAACGARCRSCSRTRTHR